MRSRNLVVIGLLTLAIAASVIVHADGINGNGFDPASPTGVAHQNTWTKAQNVALVTLTVSSHAYATDATASNVFKLSLEAGQSDTLSNPTGLVAGGQYQWITSQNASASTLAYGSDFKWPSGVAPTVTTSSGAIDVISCTADTTSTLRCTFVGDVR